jgi:phage-related baseplate assembly protein
MINTLTTYISGIDEVYNPANWLLEEGTDEETDESLRNRILLVWATKSIFTDDYYRFHTLSVDGVVDCYVDNQHPRGQGTADIYIVSSSGMPTTDLISQVQAVIDDVKTPAADILVKAPAEKPIDLDITITSYSDYPDKALIQAEAERRINALFIYNPDYKEIIFDYESRRFTIGKNITLSTIYYVLMEIEGVEKVNINSPTTDVNVNPNELPTLQSLALQVV